MSGSSRRSTDLEMNDYLVDFNAGAVLRMVSRRNAVPQQSFCGDVGHSLLI
jgi:hypothetical protein